MYAAFNTLKTKLESLVKLREAIVTSEPDSIHIPNVKREQLDAVIQSHERTIKLIVRVHQDEQRKLAAEIRIASNMLLFKKQAE